MIISGEAQPGEFLRVERIAEAVGVSNTPVREGLLALSSEGYVQLVPRRGFRVEPFSRQDVRDLFWTQAQLAGELAARAAKNIRADRLAKIEELVLEAERATENGQVDLLTKLGHRLHREINLAAESPRLAFLLNSIVRYLPNSFYAQIEGHLTTTRDAHPQLLEALRKHQVRRARELMEAHVLDGADHVIKALEARGLWDQESEAD